MAITTRIRAALNTVLAKSNLRLETLTAIRKEQDRLAYLDARGYFSVPAFPTLPCFTQRTAEKLMQAAQAYREKFDRLSSPSLNDVRYTFDNPYFSSPDAEVLYTVISEFRPRRIVEVGSGHSTRVMRQALLDSRLDSRIHSIDPQPRLDIEALVNQVSRHPVEHFRWSTSLDEVSRADLLFIDSSHRLNVGNDVVFIFLVMIPRLSPGTLIHIHDIFLPYDYPLHWVRDLAWEGTEQYVVQAMLAFGSGFEVLWPGHMLQRTVSQFETLFPHSRGRVASSLWLRKTS